MRRLRAAFVRVTALFRRDRLDRELADELESHLAHHIADNIRAGMTPDEARRRALVRLGGLTQTQEQYRDRRGIPAIERVVADVRYAARTLRTAPGFTLIAMLTLALGIGANAAIFSVINALLVQPFPVERPSELVMVDRAGSFPTHSYPDYRDFRDRNTVLSGLVAIRMSPVHVDANGRATRLWAQLASGNYFDVLGVRAMLGRTLTAADDVTPGGHPVVVLSYDCWESRFGSDPSVVGRSIKVSGKPYTVIGIAPAGFRGTERLFAPAMWIPMSMVGHIESGNNWLERRATRNVFLLGRIRPNVTPAEAEASLNTIAQHLGREHPELDEGMRISFSPPGLLGNALRGPVVGVAGALLGVAGLLLLLTCTNLTGLLLARSTDRQRDTAIRLALGASRFDLIRRSLVESALVSLVGAVLALLLANWLAAAATQWRLPTDLPLAAHVTLDYRVLTFALVLAFVSTFLVGLAPAVQGSRADVVPALKDETVRLRHGWHLRDVVVAIQVALSVVLLIGSLLVVRSLQASASVPLGFTPRGAVTARVDLALDGYDRDRAREFRRVALERIGALPDITSVATASALPLTQDISTSGVLVEGKPAVRGAATPQSVYYQVSPGFLQAFDIRLLSGRDFTKADLPESPLVAIVNQAFAKQLVGEDDPIGTRFRNGSSATPVEIIGVVQDGKYQTLTEAPRPVAFYNVEQFYNPTTSIVARTNGDEGHALEEVRQVIRAIDPALSVFEDRRMSDVLALPLVPVRVSAGLLGTFGALAMVMVLVGTYGVMSYAIAQRTREISIRLAIGASSSHIVRLVLTRAVIVWAVGASVGAAVALAGAPLLSPILLGVRPRDPVLVLFATGIIAAVTIAACWLPTRRALATEPSGLLRRG
jgi:predicted permease